VSWQKKVLATQSPATPVVAGDFEDGLAAHEAGDYQKAFRLWKPLAEQGHAKAQASLGWMYEQGRGVLKHEPVSITAGVICVQS